MFSYCTPQLSGVRVSERKDSAFHMKVGDTDKARLKRLAELEETTASALVRRLIRERAKEMGVEK